MIITADFHIHSCLSPCGDLAMSPLAIAEVLSQKGVQLAALSDHNSALNCPAFADCCRAKGIAALYGMELQTAEEVHVLALFSRVETALDFGREVYDTLPPIMNDPEKTGDQVYVDADENILGEVEKYLITSSVYGIEQAAARIHALGGLCIPSHADRAAFSLMSQFGEIIDGDWDALEVTRIPSSENTLGYPLTTSSDAHYIEHIARRPFTLDIGDRALFDGSGAVDIEVVREALQLRPR